jgi:hypothetical protein
VKSTANDTRLALAERIANSPSFARAPKLRELFLYICQTSVAGHDELLNEQQIGQQVFGRDSNYNPAEDNIVRAQVRLLRKKLEAWFQDEGKMEPVRIEIPRGSYVPLWAAQPMETEQTEAHAAPAPVEASHSPKSPGRTAALLLLASGLSFVAGWWGSHQFAPAPVAARQSMDHPLLPMLLDNRYPILLVTQDAGLIVLNNYLGISIPLAEYQSGEFLQRLASPDLGSGQQRLLNMIVRRQNTTVGDLAILRNLFDALPGMHERIQIVSARHLHQRQLKTANAILVGGTAANPWVELYDEALSFRLVREPRSGPEDPRQRFCVRSLKPGPGEQELYLNDGAVSYGVLACLPNTGGSGNVIIMAGASLEATEAASEFVFSAGKASELAGRLKSLASGAKTVHFQAIVRARRSQGTSSTSELVALRVNPPASAK